MLRLLLQVSIGMSPKWTMPALPKVQEWWSEYEQRLGSAICPGDPES